MSELETPEQIAARVRATLPPFLVRPEDVIAEEKRAAQLLAASFTRARLTDDERLIAQGIQIEQVARANLEGMGARRAEGHNVSTRGGANIPMLEREQAALAYGLELQGRFEEAAEAHPLKREQARLQKIVEAIAKPDGEHCRCPPDEADVPGRVGHPHYEVKKIYSRTHGRAVSLVGCRKCPALNATPTPPEALAASLHAHSAASARGRARLQRA